MDPRFAGVVIALTCLQPCRRANSTKWPKSSREALPTGGRPHSDRMHISDRFGLREKAKQISDDLGSVANDECRVSKLVNEEWMVQVAGITRAPEFLQLIENLVVVLLGAHRNFCGTAHRRSAGRWRARRDSNPRPPDSKSDSTFHHDYA